MHHDDSPSLDDIIADILNRNTGSALEQWKRDRWSWLSTAILVVIALLDRSFNPDTREYYKKHRKMRIFMAWVMPLMLTHSIRRFMMEPKDER